MKVVKQLSFLAVLATLSLTAVPRAVAWWTMPPYAFHKLETPRWMSWHGGVDLFGTTEGATQPNVLLHVAESVMTPLGATPSGMILWQPDPQAAPLVFGFMAADANGIGAYFGPNIFAGTPFEQAPTLSARIDITRGDDQVVAKVVVARHTFVITFSQLGPTMYMNRAPTAQTPFYQNGIERTVGRVELVVDGKAYDVKPAPMNPAGGPGAVYAEFGSYVR